MSTFFVQAANVIADRLTDLLQTQVCISDAQNTVVARYPLDADGQMDDVYATDHYSLRFPVRIDGQTGQVLIGKLAAESISPRIARAFINLLVTQTLQSKQLSPPSLSQQRLKDQVIQSLLQGSPETHLDVVQAQELLQQARELGLDLTPPRAVILIDASEFVTVSASCAKVRSQFIVDSLVSFFHLPNDTICADLGNGQFVVLKASNTKNMEPWVEPISGLSDSALTASWTNLDALKRAGQALGTRLNSETGTTVSVGIGRYHPGPLGLSRSYQDAQIALRLGRQFDQDNQVHCLDNLGIAAFACVADEQTKVELALHLISPLDNEPELLKTLQIFFNENCTLNSTAKQLLIHRNTLTYRLEKIASLTGLDPRCFDDAVQIRLALLLRVFKPNCYGV